MDNRAILKKALEDPQLEITVLNASTYKSILPMIRNLPEGSCVSEWKHSLGYLRYEYHTHNGDFANEIIELYKLGINGGNPKLIKVYSKQEFEKLIVV